MCGATAALAAACDSVSCPLNNTVESVYGFYASARADDGTFAPGEAIAIGDTLTITALGPDTVIANRIINANTVALPMSFYGQTDSLLFHFTDADDRLADDTVWIDKQSHHHWDDPSCAVHIWHNINAVRSTHNLIDTILIANPAVNYDGLENFQIYFRTAS